MVARRTRSTTGALVVPLVRATTTCFAVPRRDTPGVGSGRGAGTTIEERERDSMDSSPTPTVDRGARPVRSAGARLWRAAWIVFAVVVTVAVADYLLLFMSRVVPSWMWSVTGGAVALALAIAALRVDVVLARRARGPRGVDLAAQVVAAVLVGAWLGLLWDLLRSGCLDGTCEPPAVWKPLFVLVPIVPLGGMAVLGLLVRRGVGAPGRT